MWYLLKARTIAQSLTAANVKRARRLLKVWGYRSDPTLMEGMGPGIEVPFDCMIMGLAPHFDKGAISDRFCTTHHRHNRTD